MVSKNERQGLQSAYLDTPVLFPYNHIETEEERAHRVWHQSASAKKQQRLCGHELEECALILAASNSSLSLQKTLMILLRSSEKWLTLLVTAEMVPEAKKHFEAKIGTALKICCYSVPNIIHSSINSPRAIQPLGSTESRRTMNAGYVNVSPSICVFPNHTLRFSK